MGVGPLRVMRNGFAVLTFSSLTPELTEDAPAGAASEPFFPFFPLLGGALAPPCTLLFLTTRPSQHRNIVVSRSHILKADSVKGSCKTHLCCSSHRQLVAALGALLRLKGDLVSPV